MLDVAEAVWLENRSKFENLSISRRTVHHIEEMNKDLLTLLTGDSSDIHVLLHIIL
jgi:hypothetical protein